MPGQVHLQPPEVFDASRCGCLMHRNGAQRLRRPATLERGPIYKVYVRDLEAVIPDVAGRPGRKLASRGAPNEGHQAHRGPASAECRGKCLVERILDINEERWIRKRTHVLTRDRVRLAVRREQPSLDGFDEDDPAKTAGHECLEDWKRVGPVDGEVVCRRVELGCDHCRIKAERGSRRSNQSNAFLGECTRVLAGPSPLAVVGSWHDPSTSSELLEARQGDRESA